MTSRGEARAVLTDDISSPHFSPGVRVSCMGAGNYWHERNRERNCERNRRYYNGYDGHHHWHYRNDRYHRHHHGYNGHHHKHPAT